MEVIQQNNSVENSTGTDEVDVQEISSSSERTVLPENSECSTVVESSSNEVSVSYIGNSDVVSSTEGNFEISNATISSSSSTPIVCNDIDADSTISDDALIAVMKNECASSSSTSSYDNIMSLCSTAAEHIKLTIDEVLKLRDEDEQKLESTNCPVSLEDNLRAKIKDFEKIVEKANSPSKLSNAVHSGESISDSSDKVHNVPKVAESESPSVEPRALSEENDSNTPASCSNGSESEVSVVGDINLDGELRTKKSKHLQSKVPAVTRKTSLEEEKSKKSQKNSSVKKKGEKSVDQVLKSLSNCTTPEEKLLALCRKHIEVLDDVRSGESRLKQNERSTVVLLREKEQLQADHNRTILAKSRLESLCRELQRQNKAIKEESLLRIREEEEKRKDVSNKFQTTLNEISTLMKDNSERNDMLKDENGQLANKLKLLVDHYDMWEKHMKKLGHQKELEVQLANAKLAKSNLQLRKETENFLQEKQRILLEMRLLQDKCTELTSNELKLRTELSVYTAKYDDFQTVLSKSNEVFATFKTDMETTSKKIKKLEKETIFWKQKAESSNNALLDMIAEKQERDKEFVNTHQRIMTLEKLCRALQAERNDLQKQIKEVTDKDSNIIVKNGDCDTPSESLSPEAN